MSDIPEFKDNATITYIQRYGEGNPKVITNMEDFVLITYKELERINQEHTMRDWVLKEAGNPSEPHTPFVSAFIYTAFKMFEAKDWSGLL